MAGANIVGSMFKSYPASASLSRTAVVQSISAKTRMHSIPAIFVVVLVLVAITPLLSTLPKAILGSVVRQPTNASTHTNTVISTNASTSTSTNTRWTRQSALYIETKQNKTKHIRSLCMYYCRTSMSVRCDVSMSGHGFGWFGSCRADGWSFIVSGHDVRYSYSIFRCFDAILDISVIRCDIRYFGPIIFSISRYYIRYFGTMLIRYSVY